MTLMPIVEKVNTEMIGLDVHEDLTVYSRLNRCGEEVESVKVPTGHADLVGSEKSADNPLQLLTLRTCENCAYGRHLPVALEVSNRTDHWVIIHRSSRWPRFVIRPWWLLSAELATRGTRPA